MADDILQDDRTTRWARAGALPRWILGALSLVGGLTWILVTMHGPTAALDLAVGVVLAAAGLVLLMPHRIQLPRLATAAAMIGVGLAGTASGLASSTAHTCCNYAYILDRGWPFTWAQRAAIAEDPATAERLANGSHWTVDAVALTTDLVLWAYAGMLLVVVAVLVRRRRA